MIGSLSTPWGSEDIWTSLDQSGLRMQGEGSWNPSVPVPNTSSARRFLGAPQAASKDPRAVNAVVGACDTVRRDGRAGVNRGLETV